MKISLTPQLEAVIRAKVDSGMYNNASEVVRETLRIMKRDGKLQRSREEIQIGIDQFERGEWVECTPQTMERLRREAEENARPGETHP